MISGGLKPRQMFPIAAMALGGIALLAVAIAELSLSLPWAAEPQSASNENVVAGTSQSPASAESGLYAWSAREGRWELGGAGMLETARLNRGIAPLLLRIHGLEPGAQYELTLTYRGCESGLTSLRGAGASWRPLKSAPAGPGRAQPDATLLVPESYTAGHRGERFELWGATFSDSRNESLGTEPCGGPRDLGLTVLANSGTVFLMWGGYLPAAPAGRCGAITARLDATSDTLSALDCPSTTFQ